MFCFSHCCVYVYGPTCIIIIIIIIIIVIIIIITDLHQVRLLESVEDSLRICKIEKINLEK